MGIIPSLHVPVGILSYKHRKEVQNNRIDLHNNFRITKTFPIIYVYNQFNSFKFNFLTQPYI